MRLFDKVLLSTKRDESFKEKKIGSGTLYGAYGNGMYLVGGAWYLYLSNDGENFQRIDLTNEWKIKIYNNKGQLSSTRFVTPYISKVGFYNDKFIVIGSITGSDYAGAVVGISENGVDWESFGFSYERNYLGLNNIKINDCAYFNNKYILLATATNSNGFASYYSTLAYTGTSTPEMYFTELTKMSDRTADHFLIVDNKLIACSDLSIITSDDLKTWVWSDNIGRVSLMRYDNNKKLYVGLQKLSNSSNIYLKTSEDLIQWETISSINKKYRIDDMNHDDINNLFINGEEISLIGSKIFISKSYGKQWGYPIKKNSSDFFDCFVGNNKLIVTGSEGYILVKELGE